MKKLLLLCSLLLATNTFAGVKGLELGTKDEIRTVNVITEKESFKGKSSLKVYADPEVTDSIKEKTSYHLLSSSSHLLNKYPIR